MALMRHLVCPTSLMRFYNAQRQEARKSVMGHRAGSASYYL
jgi:hypothetical protein